MAMSIPPTTSLEWGSICPGPSSRKIESWKKIQKLPKDGLRNQMHLFQFQEQLTGLKEDAYLLSTSDDGALAPIDASSSLSSLLRLILSSHAFRPIMRFYGPISQPNKNVQRQ